MAIDENGRIYIFTEQDVSAAELQSAMNRGLAPRTDLRAVLIGEGEVSAENPNVSVEVASTSLEIEAAPTGLGGGGRWTGWGVMKEY